MDYPSGASPGVPPEPQNGGSTQTTPVANLRAFRVKLVK